MKSNYLIIWTIILELLNKHPLNMIIKKTNFLKKDIIIISLLVIIFLLIRIPILFTFQGVLGGDESYEINKIIQLVLKGDIFSFRYYSFKYAYVASFLQIPFTLPFYLLFPTNEFSSFLGTTFTCLIIMVSLFIFLKKHFNRNIAIFSSLMFIISPIGFTISTLSEDTTGNNLILLLLIPFMVL